MNLFTKTWKNDFQWIELAIYSVLKNCAEPVNWNIAVERLDRGALDEIIGRARAHFPHRLNADVFKTHDCELIWPDCQNIVSGYMRQQWIKMNVHKLVHNHLCWNWDSDVIATGSFNSSTFMKGDKPVWWWDDMNELIIGGYPQARKDLLCDIFSSPCGKEFMRCMPIPLLGEALAKGEGSLIWQRALNYAKNNHPALSEFNIMGEFCFRDFNNRFHWQNAHVQGPTWQGEANDPSKVTYQAWSWGGVNEGIRSLVLK